MSNTIEFTREQIEADHQIGVWKKVAKAAKKVGNKKEEQNANKQIDLWTDKFFKESGININWLDPSNNQ